ncbi:GatB-domain-containing protein [Gyrodon lividus]|nr:GatB-domain-containing protein [Gyrodon lividus]
MRDEETRVEDLMMRRRQYHDGSGMVGGVVGWAGMAQLDMGDLEAGGGWEGQGRNMDRRGKGQTRFREDCREAANYSGVLPQQIPYMMRDLRFGIVPDLDMEGLITEGVKLVLPTRTHAMLYNPAFLHPHETFKLRSKEDSPDYRYMPDPNLPLLLLSPEYIENVWKSMPELPEETHMRLMSVGLTEQEAEGLMAVDTGWEVGFDGEYGKGAVAYFDCLAQGHNARTAVNWMTHELLGQLAACKETFSDNPVSMEQMGKLIDMVQSGKVTGTSGKTLLCHIITSHSTASPSTLAQQLSLLAISDDDSALVEKWCSEAIEALPEEADKV